jgi:hypothetical protein
MRADIKLCTSSFSAATLFSFCLVKVIFYVHVCSVSWVPPCFAPVEEILPLRKKVDCILQLAYIKSYTHTQTKQHQFTNLWCVGINVWKIWEMSCDMDHHTIQCPRQYQMNTWSISEEPLKVWLLNKFIVLLCSTVHYVLCKRLKLHACKFHLVQQITWTDDNLRKQFALQMLFRIEEDKTYLERLCFSDDETFHMCGTVKRHNCHE